MSEQAFDTRCVRAGISPDPTTGAIVPPLYQTATYVLPEVGRDLGFDYTRSSNPTRKVMEDNLAALGEGARLFGAAVDGTGDGSDDYIVISRGSQIDVNGTANGMGWCPTSLR